MAASPDTPVPTGVGDADRSSFAPGATTPADEEGVTGSGGEWEAFADWFCAYWIRRAHRGMDERR